MRLVLIGAIGDPMVIISGNVLPQSEAALYLKRGRDPSVAALGP